MFYRSQLNKILYESNNKIECNFRWRKKHAAEMATAKRKQEELGDGDGDLSEAIDSDAESLDMSESPRKRCRMDDDLRH